MRVFALEVQDASIQPVRGSATYTRRPASGVSTYPATAASIALPNAPESSTHRVAPGENLTRIVQERLSASGQRPSNFEVYERVKQVARANGLANPDLIHPGQEIDLSVLNGESATRQDVANTALPSLVLPDPGPTMGAPVPRPGLRGSRPLEAPSARQSPEQEHAAPMDSLIDPANDNPAGEPLRISRAAVANLLTPPVNDTKLAQAPTENSGPAGGPGPVPSDAVVALQRLLNGTSSAIHALRNIMDDNHAPHPETTESGPWSSLVRGKARISSEYGTRKDPFTGRIEFHEGVDLAVKRGTDITAVRDGVVVHSGWKGGYGNTVILSHEGGVETLYAHAAKTHVEPGQKVKAGTLIAAAGSSGRSTGPHVHFEVREHGRAVNPMPYLDGSGI